MLKRSPLATNLANPSLPLQLSSILLVESDPELRASRRLLLGVLRHPVLAIGAFADVCDLPKDSNCALVAIDLGPSEQEARRIATHTRRTWPNAKIMLLGRPSGNFEDPLYDDSVNPCNNPSEIVACANRLLHMRGQADGTATGAAHAVERSLSKD